MDIYTLSRIFKNFDINKENRKNPRNPKNIIVYAGKAHTDDYLVYLRDYEHFKVVEVFDQKLECSNRLSIKDIYTKYQPIILVKFLKRMGIDVIKNLNIDLSVFGPIDTLLVDIDDDLLIDINDYLKNYRDLIISYVESLNDDIKQYLISNYCATLDDTSCLNISTLRQPLFTN